MEVSVPLTLLAVPDRRLSKSRASACPHPCSAQPKNVRRSTIRAVPSRRVSLQCHNAQLHSPHTEPQNIIAVPKRRVSLQRPTAEYPCSATVANQLNPRVSLTRSTPNSPCGQHPTAELSLQSSPAVHNPKYSRGSPTLSQSLAAVPNFGVSLESLTSHHDCSLPPQRWCLFAAWHYALKVQCGYMLHTLFGSS